MADKAAIARKINPIPPPKRDPNYIKEGPTPGTYINWQTASGKKPDFGVGFGPGTPYREVTKNYNVKPISAAIPPSSNPIQNPRLPMGGIPRVKLPTANIKPLDAKSEAIRRRLNNGG